MAMTIKEIGEGWIGQVGGPLVWRAFDLTPDTSYPTGGYSLSAAELKVSKALIVLAQPTAALARMVTYDYTNSKLKWIYMDHTHTENTAGAYVQNATTAAATGNTTVETANANNVSSCTVRVFVIGTAP